MGKKRRRRSSEEMQNQLEKQMRFLVTSCKAFDKGNGSEAVRIAGVLRTLFHSGQYSCLLGELDMLDQLQFLDTGIYRDRLVSVQNARYESSGFTVVAHQAAEVGLVVEGMGHRGEPSWVAPLAEKRFPSGHPFYDANEETKPFQSWWSGQLIETSNKRKFSRKRLVTIMANEDGHAHVDPEIDIAYDDLCQDFLGRQYAVGVDLDINDPNIEWQTLSGNVAESSVRQIAFEVMVTLDRFYNRDWVKQSESQPFRMHSLPHPGLVILGK